jgi:putative ABC transport system permease protein
VNESLARRTWPRGDAVGQRLVVDYLRGAYTYEVVGVVNDLRFYGLKREPRPEVYFPHAQVPYLGLNVVVRTKTDPAVHAKAVEQAVLELDPSQPVHSSVTLQRLVETSMARDRFAMGLLGLLAAIALVLAATGIYGVMAYMVSQRTHEIGVRMALGAQQRDVLQLILGQSLRLTLAGALLGLAAAYASTRVLSSLLFGISATDPATFGAVGLLLAAVATVAGYLPARRAARVDPMQALRHD